MLKIFIIEIKILILLSSWLNGGETAILFLTMESNLYFSREDLQNFLYISPKETILLSWQYKRHLQECEI
jgi:hypothetical protein